MRTHSLLLAAILLAALPATAQKAKSPANRPVRTPQEVEALIEKAGKAAPDWWKSVKVNYPKTLDLSFPPKPGGPWDANKNVGQYMWSVINENPAKWQEGVRFLHHLLTVNKDNPDTLNRVMDMMGRSYHILLQDPARAVFWWRKAGTTDTAEIANCYWEMGCKEMAVELLEKIGPDQTRNCTVVKLWADMGETEKALGLAGERPDDAGYLAAGEACRLAGRYDEAIAFYDKVLAMPGGDRDLPRNQARAKASLEAVRLFDALDLKRVRAGKYKADSMGYEFPLEVEVTVGGGRIASVKITKHQEKQFYGSLTETPALILAKQTVKGIETTSGATITSEAIINATAKALSQGVPRKK